MPADHDARPPWLTPIAYNDPADGPPPAPSDDETFVRRGPHDAVMGLDDEDEIDPDEIDPTLDQEFEDE